MALLVHLYPFGLEWRGRVPARRDHVRSHDDATCCRASLAACKPRRRSPKMAEVAVLGVFFEHPFTGVNGVRKRDQACGRGSGSPCGKLVPTLQRGNDVFNARRCPMHKARDAQRPGRCSHGDRGSECDAPGFEVKRILRQPLSLKHPQLMVCNPHRRSSLLHSRAVS
jgi:hypothetical protein